MAIRSILQLGTPSLFETCRALTRQDVLALAEPVRDLHDTMRAFQTEHGWGRAIAAPQIGVQWRIVAMQVGATQRAIDDRSLALRSTQPPKNLSWRGEFSVLP